MWGKSLGWIRLTTFEWWYDVIFSESDKAKQIYDGRRSLMEEQNGYSIKTEKSQVTENSSIGEIVYFRDSDDERPDSDEDPDDDLDI